MTREEQLQRESEVYAWTANQFDIKLAFKKGAEWEHKRLVHNACEWLLNNAHLYVYATTKETRALMFDNFKKTLEE